MDEITYKLIFARHVKILKSFCFDNNKKLLICFSAVPGSGKTHIAKILEEKYKAVRINSDDVRGIIENVKGKISDEETNKILQEYLTRFLSTYNRPNKLIILDSSIDRKYDEISIIAKRLGYELFIIRIVADQEIINERIRVRNKGGEKGYLDAMKRWIADNEEFNRKNKINITVDNSKNLDLESLFKSLNNKLYKSSAS